MTVDSTYIVVVLSTVTIAKLSVSLPSQGTPDLCYGRSDKLVKYSAQRWSEEMLRKNEMSHSGE